MKYLKKVHWMVLRADEILQQKKIVNLKTSQRKLSKLKQREKK